MDKLYSIWYVFNHGVVMNIFHISDLHFNSHDLVVLAHIEKIFSHIAQSSIKPDILLITGDILNRDFCDYKPVFDKIKKLNIPFLCITGNHDNSQNLILALQTYCPHHPLPQSSSKLDYVCNQFPLKFIALDTFEENTPGGNLSAHQLKFMENEIINSDKPVVILIHQFPLWADLDFFDKKTGAPWRQKFCNIVKQHSDKIKLVACGHLHNHLSGLIDKTPVVSSFSANWQAHLDFLPVKSMKNENLSVGYMIHRYIDNQIISYAVCL